MSTDIYFIQKDDLIEAVPVNKHWGFAISFVQEQDIKNKRKKKRAYAISSKKLEGLEKYCKLQREFFNKRKNTPVDVEGEG